MGKHHNKKGITESLVSQNIFYYNSVKLLKILRLLLVLVNVVVLILVFKAIDYRPEPQYFAASPEGRIITINPLTNPVVSDSYVVQWVSDKVRRSLSLDYIHYKDQLQDIAQSFTPYGWTSFSDAWERSLNLKTLVNDEMITDVDITSAPVIKRKGVNGDRYVWLVDLPVSVTFNSKTKQKRNSSYNVSVIIMRMDVKDYPDYIAINNYLPILTKEN